MKIREYELFRSYYCGLCKSIGDRYGQVSRLSLTYDCTFLALVLDGVYNDKINIKEGRCALHPIKKKKIVGENFFVNYAADCNIILSYNKLIDNKIDDGRLRDNVASSLFSKAYKKSKEKHPSLSHRIEVLLSTQRDLEAAGCDSIDEVAEPFAKITEALFSNDELFEKLREHQGADNPAEFDNTAIKALKWLGYNIGKWIYIVDCFDDLKRDYEKDEYNVILRSKPMEDGESIDEYKVRITENISFILDYSMAEAGKAIDLMELKHGKGIIENIIYSGLHIVQKEVSK